MAGTIFSDPKKGLGLVDYAGPNPLSPGTNTARLRLSNAVGVVQVNIQSFAPSITGNDFDAAASSAKIGGVDVSNCVAIFGYEAGQGFWQVTKDGNILSAGTAVAGKITVEEGPS